MLILHHNDLDGRAAAAVILNSNLRQYERQIDCVEMNYDRPVPWDRIEPEETVWITDFSLSPEDMRKLLTITKTVVWIDHHRTAIDKFKDFETPVEGLRHDGLSGCVLTWLYLNRLGVKDVDKVPLGVRLIGDFDCWTFNKPGGFGRRAEEFYFGMMAGDNGPEAEVWLLLRDDNEVEPIQGRGRTIMAYRQQFFRDYLKSWGYEIQFEGHRCLAVCCAQTGSGSFDSRKADDFDILISYVHSNRGYAVSLYTLHTDRIDVSAICKKHGGGGHRGASGFQCQKLPW